MLQFITGLSGTGKTHTVLAQLAQRAHSGQYSLLLVPEQATSWAEGTVYRLLGDGAQRYVHVASFTGYAEDILTAHGGIAAKTLTDAGRAVYVRRAMDAVQDSLVCYKRQARNTNFCAMCAAAIKELKIAGAVPQQLSEIARGLQDGGRMQELSLIFAAYEALLQGTALDPSDRVSIAAQRLPCEELAATAVFIDDFSGFTAPEYAMLAKLLVAESCTVTLCCNDLFAAEDYSLFSPVRHTAARLRRLAAKNGVPVANVQQLSADIRHAQTPQLAALNTTLAGNAAPCAGQAITFTEYAGVHAACHAVACHCVQQVRSGQYTYGQLAVVCRDAKKWAKSLQQAFAAAGVPVFIDEKATLEHTPPARFCRLALTLLRRGISTETMLQLAKTGICGIPAEDIALLENYAFTWALTAADWRSAFTRNPEGFTEEFTQEAQAQLAQINAVRSALTAPVERFLSIGKKAKAKDICRGLYLLLQAFHADEHTLALADSLRNAGRQTLADDTLRTWNGMMELLSHMALLLGEDELDAAEMDDLFLLMLRATELGSVPQTQDAVLFTSADRMRLDNPAVCFVLGVNQDEFPSQVGYSGLLSHADRAFLQENNIEMPGSYETRTLLERMMLYRTLTAPCSAVHISCIAPAVCGAPCAGALQEVLQCFTPQPLALAESAAAPTPAVALDMLGEAYRTNAPFTASLQAALAQQSLPYPAVLHTMQSVANNTPFAVAPAAMEKLLGERLTLSPTRVESYHHCRFAYFVEYGLGIRPRRAAEISPLTNGNLVHYILEQVLRTAGEAFADMPQNELQTLANTVTDSYIAAAMPGVGARFAQLLERIKNNVYLFLLYMQEEQRQSSFHPVAYELPIGTGAQDIQPVTLTAPNGHTVRVVGKIDRVDVMQREGGSYIRVVDYKTGTKKFDLAEVYCGLNMQMLLYLFTLCKNGESRFPSPLAAGVLYLKADPAPVSETRSSAKDTPTYALDGIILDDAAVIHGMNRSETQRFLPLTYNKNGTVRSGKKMLASLAKLGNIEHHIEDMLVQMASGLYAGEIAAVPLCNKDKTGPCDYCEFRCICRHESGQPENVIAAPKDVFEEEAPHAE